MTTDFFNHLEISGTLLQSEFSMEPREGHKIFYFMSFPQLIVLFPRDIMSLEQLIKSREHLILYVVETSYGIYLIPA